MNPFLDPSSPLDMCSECGGVLISDEPCFQCQIRDAVPYPDWPLFVGGLVMALLIIVLVYVAFSSGGIGAAWESLKP